MDIQSGGRRALTEDDLVELSRRQIHQMAISGNGCRAAVVTGYTDDVPHSQYSRDIMRRCLWVMAHDSPGQTLLCDQDAHAPAWSNSGQTVAYLSRASGTTQIWRIALNIDSKQQLTGVQGRDGNAFQRCQLIWTPDDQRVVFTTTGANEPENDTQPGKYKNPVDVQSTQRPQEAYRPGPVQLWSVAATGGEPELLATLDHPFRKLIGWPSDGDTLLLSCGADIRSVSLLTGEQRLMIRKGHRLAALDQSGELWLLEGNDGALEIGRVTRSGWEQVRSFEYDAFLEEPLALLPDVGKLYLLRRRGVIRRLVAADLNTGNSRTITGSDEVAAADHNPSELLSVPPGGPLWLPVSTPDRPAEIYVNAPDVGKRRVSDLNPLAERLKLPEVRRITWQSDRWEIEGLLVLPTNGGRRGRCPTLAYLHGGPERLVEYSFESLSSPRGESAAYYLAGNGFAVLLVNFRGSQGYGKEFLSQLGDYHLLDRPSQDVMAGVDALVADGIADPEALGIYGQSYGAMLTAWTIGHTDMFRGAVMAACGHYDLELHARYSGRGFHTLNDMRKGSADPNEVWQRPELWRLISPMEHVHKVRTPVLFVETSAERRPGQEARPFFNTLRAVGVEACMAYYPNAFHGGGWNDGYKRDYMRRTLVWFRHALLDEDLPAWFSESPHECE